ncbi:putative late blight resistance protein homolog R1A-4 isoform X3 [Nicotiana sylvestris]
MDLSTTYWYTWPNDLVGEFCVGVHDECHYRILKMEARFLKCILRVLTEYSLPKSLKNHFFFINNQVSDMSTICSNYKNNRLSDGRIGIASNLVRKAIQPKIREILVRLWKSNKPWGTYCVDMFSIVSFTLEDLVDCMADRLAPDLLEKMKSLSSKLTFERRLRWSIRDGFANRENNIDIWLQFTSDISYSVACLNCLYWLDDIPEEIARGLRQCLSALIRRCEELIQIDAREVLTRLHKASELLLTFDTSINDLPLYFVDFVLDSVVQLHNSKENSKFPTKGLSETLHYLGTSIADRLTQSTENLKLKGQEVIRRIYVLRAEVMEKEAEATNHSFAINPKSIQDLCTHYSRREQKLMIDPFTCMKWLEKHGEIKIRHVALELDIRLQYLQFILKRQPSGQEEFNLVHQTMKTIGTNIHEACINAKYGRVDFALSILESQLTSMLKDFDLRQEVERAHSLLSSSANDSDLQCEENSPPLYFKKALLAQGAPMPTQLAIEFISTLLLNLKCLVSYRLKPKATVKREMEIFEVKLSFLRGFLKLTSIFFIKSERLENLVARIIALVGEAACISYWCYPEKLSRKMEHEMSHTISDLLSRMKSFEAEMRDNYLIALEASHSSQSEYRTPYSSKLVVAVIDSLVDNFMELADKGSTSLISKALRIETIHQDQSFLITLLKDLRRQCSENIKFDDLLTYVKAQSDKMNQAAPSVPLDLLKEEEVSTQVTSSLLQLTVIIKLIKAEFFLMDLQQSIPNSTVSWKGEIPILSEELKALTTIAIDVLWQCDCHSRNVEALSDSFEHVINVCDITNVTEHMDEMLFHGPFELSVKVKLIKSEISLRKLLKNQINIVDPVKDNFDNLLMDLEFLGTLLLDLPEQYAKQERRNHLLSCVDVVAAEIDTIIESHCSKKDVEGMAGRMELQLSDVLQKIKLIKAEDREICPKIPKLSRTNFPMTDGLGFLDLLVENLAEILNFKGDRIILLKRQVETIQRELKFLREFLEKIAQQRNEHVELRSVWEKVVGVAYEVEYAIDSYVANGGGTIWHHTFSDIVEDIKLIKGRVIKISTSDLYDSRTHSLGEISHISTHIEKPTINEAVVGFEDVLATLKQRVIGGSPDLDVITIFGMPGLGKTTLAKKVYDDCKAVNRFDVCVWCCISERYEKKSLLIDILQQINIALPENVEEKSEGDLADLLRRSIMGRRYLIFMDDIWTIEAWDDVKTPFRDDKQGSRIILTTRHAEVASYAKCTTDPLRLRFFHNEESWMLLVQKLFQGQQCPPELVDVGKRIAEKCQGLPLSVVLVAGLLGKMETKEDGWLQVAESLSTTTVGDSSSRGIIELSYKHLPEYLKPCFLYFGGFMEDEEIPVSKLTWKWIAEGLVRKHKPKSLEDMAEEYLVDLISRSLVMDAKMRYNGRVKSCRIHDLLHEFCQNKAKEEKFWQYVYSYQDKDSPDIDLQDLERRRMLVSPDGRFASLRLVGSPVRSLLLMTANNVETNVLSVSFIKCFRLLKVLDLERINLLDSFPDEIEQLIHLTFLAVRTGMTSIPAWIYKLEKLETLLIKGLRGEVALPDSLWDMARLRHVHINDRAAFGFAKEVIENSSKLDDLETFSTPSLAYGDDMEKMMRKFSNLKKLKCRFLESVYYSMKLRKDYIRFPILDFLVHLESLKVFSNGKKLSQPCEFKFPENLKKLTLSNFRLPWKEISIIARLPNLEVLKLLRKAFEGEKWEVKDDEFPALKALKLDDVVISQWDVSDDAFPSLEKLVLQRCKKLKEIPSCFGYNCSIQSIEVSWCSLSVTESAKQIQDTQVDDMGNGGFKIFI